MPTMPALWPVCGRRRSLARPMWCCWWTRPGWPRPTARAVPADQVGQAGRGHSGQPARRPTADGVTWTGFSTRARVIAYDPPASSRRRGHLRAAGRPQAQGHGVHPLGLAPLQPVAVRHRGRAHGRRRKAKPGSRAWSTTWPARPRAATPTRSRPWPRANARGADQQLLRGPPAALQQARRQGRDGQSAVVFPNQGTSGTHVNIAGAAVAKHAKNRDNAVPVHGVPGQPVRPGLLRQRQQRIRRGQGREDRQPGPARHGRRRLQGRRRCRWPWWPRT
jgi:hypothetical protein